MLHSVQPSSRGTKQLETVATRVIAATGSFYSARGIGTQASVGAAVDEECWAGKNHLINCFGIERVLFDLYLKTFDLTKGLLFDTFVVTVWYKLCRCDHSVLEFISFLSLINWTEFKNSTEDFL